MPIGDLSPLEAELSSDEFERFKRETRTAVPVAHERVNAKKVSHTATSECSASVVAREFRLADRRQPRTRGPALVQRYRHRRCRLEAEAFPLCVQRGVGKVGCPGPARDRIRG